MMTAPFFKKMPLVLPPELLSTFSDSTDTEAMSYRYHGFPHKFVTPFWNDFNLSPKQSLKMSTEINDSKRMNKIMSTSVSPPKMSHLCSDNQHLLDLDVIAKHNNFCANQKKGIFNLRCKKNCLHTVEITFLNDNEVIVRFLDKFAQIGKVQIERSLVKKRNIVLEFMRFFGLFKDPNKLSHLFGGYLNKRNRFHCSINYENIRNCMMDFFKNKSIDESVHQLNDFEFLYFGVFILKKNFNDWSADKFDLNKLQRSETKKRKEHFLKFILKKLFKYLNAKNRNFFGKKNKDIVQRMKSIFFEGIKRNPKRDPSSNRMENLGKVLSSNVEFKNFYDKSDIDQVILELFNEYSKKPMDTLINNHINRLKSYMDKEPDPQKRTVHFVKYIFKLKTKKLKNMWTFQEFKQSQEVLNYIMSSN